jgi:purine-nucleoside phosphorylase
VEIYRSRLVSLALSAARRAGGRARAGVYARLLGPTYETRAEYRMLLRLGADAVGMSTIPEVLAARRLGVDVVAVSVITNVANPDAPEETDAEDVCRLAAGAADGLWEVIRALAIDMAGEGPERSTTTTEDR